MQNDLLKKGLAGVIILLFIGAGIIPSTVGIYETKQSPKDDKKSFMGFNPRGDILYVGGSGPNNYTKIQDAIDAASNEDTVFVYDYSSPYYENVDVDKSIDLIGENRETTVIDGSETGDVVHISSDWVNVTGFTLQNSGVQDGSFYAGVRVLSNNNTVSECAIVNNQVGIGIVSTDNNQIVGNEISSDEYGNAGEIRDGIKLSGSNSNNNLIQENTITHHRNGIGIDGSNNTIIENEIANSANHGISIGSNDNIVQDNTITETICNAGIKIRGDNNQIIGNEVNGLGGQGYGLDLCEACDNIIQDNDIHDAGAAYSIYMRYHSDRNRFINNTISNSYEGIHSDESNGCYFEGNNMVNNEYRDMTFGGYLYNTTLLNNDMDSGIMIDGAADVNNNIMVGNTVNGEPLIYKEDESYITIENEPAGQVILVNCDNVTVDAMDLLNIVMGLELIDSNNCIISNNSFNSNNEPGVALMNSDHNMVQDNSFSDIISEWGGGVAIWLGYSSCNNTLDNNQISNVILGIKLSADSNQNLICNNNIVDYENQGISIMDCSCNNQIESNTISSNLSNMLDGCIGVLLCDQSDNNNLSYNTISNSYIGVTIGFKGSVSNTTLYMNTFENCVFDFQDNTPPIQMFSLNNIKTSSYEHNPTRILKNNFMGLKLFARFQVADPSASFTTWQNNYWGRFRILPKLIIGLNTNMIPVQLKIDWHPARKPYEI